MADFADTVRASSPDRYFSALYAPEPMRRDLLALYAFDIEIASIRQKVSEPMLGEIRLQWWRDALEARAGQGNPLAEAVLGVMARHDLPMQALLDLVEARVFDLYDDPFPTLNDLEGYAGETAGRVMMLAGAILAPDMPQTGPIADAAGHGGVALVLRDALFTPYGADAARYLPGDVRARHDLPPSETPEETAPGLAPARQALMEATGAHLAAFALASEAIAAPARPAFMPVALARLDVARGGTAPLWRRLWALRRAARKGLAA